MEAIDPYVAFSLGALAFGVAATIGVRLWGRSIDRRFGRRDP